MRTYATLGTALLAAAIAAINTHHTQAALWLLAFGQAAALTHALSTGDPRMSKGRARFKLAEIRQRHAEKIGGETVEIETEDGSVFEVPAPGFWNDDAKELFAKNLDVAGVKALIGPREYLRFVQAGGRADDVALVLKAFAAEQGLSVGESTASPTS